MQRAVGQSFGPFGDRARNERGGCRVVPRLGDGGDWELHQKERWQDAPEDHRRAILRAVCRWASSVAIAVLASCTDVGGPGGGSLATDELLLLGVQAGAPAVTAQSFYVSNARTTVRRLQHSDAFGTLFLELQFPTGAIARLDGVPVGSDDSVLVTLTPIAGRYGITVAPPGLGFARTARPSATFSFARYGDLSVADGSPTYDTRAAYAAALDLWRETSSELWQVAAGSTVGGGDEVVGGLDGGGRYVVAAPR